MTSPDFIDLLSMDAADAVRPPAMPGGTYRALVRESESVKARDPEKPTPGIKFKLTNFDPLADVDVDAWEAYKAHPTVDPDNIAISNNDTTFWTTRKAMFMLKDFCIACGSDETGQMSKLVSQAMQQTVLVQITQSVSKDGKGVYNNIAGFKKDE